MARSSYIDDRMHRRGTLTLTGLHWARSGYAEWVRFPGEGEKAFMDRAKASAKAEGYRIVTFGGALHIDDTFHFEFNKGDATNGRKFTEDAER